VLAEEFQEVFVDELLAVDLRELDALGKGPLLEGLRQEA
jgi:hypothetical protein